jgi:hypothetical protein
VLTHPHAWCHTATCLCLDGILLTRPRLTSLQSQDLSKLKPVGQVCEEVYSDPPIFLFPSWLSSSILVTVVSVSHLPCSVVNRVQLKALGVTYAEANTAGGSSENSSDWLILVDLHQWGFHFSTCFPSGCHANQECELEN